MNNYTVLMSVYYKEDPTYFRQSIQSMLDQTVPTNDFTIVCDGKLTSELDKVIDNYCALYPQLFLIVRLDKNQGLATALNYGLRYCKNDLVARMDSDDYAVRDRCEIQLGIFDIMDVDIVGGTVAEFENDINSVTAFRAAPETNDEIISFARKRNPFNHPCVMYKKSSVLKVGGYQDFSLFEDYDLWVRMLMSGAKGYNIQHTLLYMRGNKSMYKRRGGISYCAAIIRFRKHLREIGFTNYREFLATTIGHCIISILPCSLRSSIYKSFLRNN